MLPHLLSNDFWTPLFRLLLASLIVMGTPGPSTLSAMAIGAAFGIRRSIGYAVGLIVGTTTVLIAIALGVLTLLVATPWLTSVLSIAGALYVLYLAFRIATAPPLAEPDHNVAAPSFFPALALGVSNPKAYLAIASVFTGTTGIGTSPASDAVMKAIALTIMIIAIHFAWLISGGKLAHYLRKPSTARAANITFASILVCTAVVPLFR